MKIRGVTDIGVSRSENQDNFWASLLQIDGQEMGVVCVCDGMGGLSNGGTASRIVVEDVRSSLLEGVDVSNLASIIKQSNTTIYNVSKSGSKMGTTCTTICCIGSKFFLFHIGDSRCYQIRGNKIRQLSTDHSAIKKFNIPKEDSRYEKYKSKLTRCIGVKPSIQIDSFAGDYVVGDKFMLCSDGFWHTFEESNNSLPLDNLEGCIKSCIKHGEKDNITVCMLEV